MTAMNSPMSGIASIILSRSASMMSLADVDPELVADGLKMIFGMTLAIGSRMFQMFSVLRRWP